MGTPPRPSAGEMLQPPEAPLPTRLREAWLGIATPTLTGALVVGAVASSLADHRLETIAWVSLALVAVVTGRSTRPEAQGVGWLGAATAGFVLAVLTASVPLALTVLTLGAGWLVVGALVLVPPATLRTSGVAVATLAVCTLLVRHRLEPLPELGGPVELAAAGVGLVVTLGGLHALGVATFRALAAQHQRTSQLSSAIATLESELADAHARVLATHEDTDRLLAAVSHELRTPLNAVRGYTEIVLEDLEDTELVGIQHDLSRIHVATSQLLDRIGSMLELTPVDPLGRDLEVVPVDIAGVIADAVGVVARRLEGNGNHLRLAGPSEQVQFCTDLVRLRHLIVELLSHASALTRNGHVLVTWQVEVPHLDLSVTGGRPGPPDDGTRDVGLAGPRRLVASLEGTLEVASDREGGRVVRVRLPDLDRRV